MLSGFRHFHILHNYQTCYTIFQIQVLLKALNILAM